MAYLDFLSSVHTSTVRDYLARVNDPGYPKAVAAELAKKWGFDYWDGDRRICYGGYRYMPGRWAPVGQAMVNHYGIKPGDKIKFRDRKAMDDDQIYTGTFLGMGPTSTIDNQSILRAAVISVDGVHHPEFVDPAVLVLVK